ncbi:MAG: thiolase family protein [archaeon]|nr:thiolase family protein [archaeon]
MSVFISRIGFTKVGDHWEKSIAEMAFQASKNILKEESSSPDAIIVANALSELSSSQGNLGTIIADALDLQGVPAYRVEAAGASGGSAINLGCNLIRAGQMKSVLVLGVEKMRDLDPAKVMQAQGLSENADYSQFFGISIAAMNALLARLYMHEYGVTREKLSAIPVVSHRNSSTAEHAQFKKKFTNEEVSRSESVADPLRVLDCAPVGDGASCALLVSEDKLSSDQRKESVEVLASESSSNIVNFFERGKMLHFGATQTATEKALKKSRLTMEEIDFLEVHDSYSELAALSLESMGLSKPGKACDDANSGRFDLNGQFPISTFGGMKGRGYPVGAAGIYQVCEAYMQLTEKAGFNQVPNARFGLVHSMSGIDSSAFVHILASSARRNRN